MMWGANVKTPVDMPDDILKDSIMKTKELIAGCAHIDADGMITRHDITMFPPCIEFSYPLSCILSKFSDQKHQRSHGYILGTKLVRTS